MLVCCVLPCGKKTSVVCFDPTNQGFPPLIPDPATQNYPEMQSPAHAACAHPKDEFQNFLSELKQPSMAATSCTSTGGGGGVMSRPGNASFNKSPSSPLLDISSTTSDPPTNSLLM